MKRRPYSILAITIFYALVPVLHLLILKWSNNVPWTGSRGLFKQMAWIQIGTFLFYPLISVGIYRVSKWGFYLFLIFSTFVIFHNLYKYIFEPLYSVKVTILVHLCLLGFIGYFLQLHILAPYFNPKLKWWDTGHRYKTKFRAQIRLDQSYKECEILDVSESGCFLTVSHDLQLGDSFWLHMSLEKFNFVLMCQVMAIKGDHGFGCMFVSMTPDNTEGLSRLINFLTFLQNSDINDRTVA